MPVVQTKSSELTATLNEFRDSELDTFTISRLKRDIRKISNYDERYMLLGMLAAIQGDADCTIENFEKSLQLSQDEVIYDNFIVALGNLNKHALAREKSIRFADGSHDPSLIKLALHYSYLYLDLNEYINNMYKLTKLKALSPNNGLVHKKEISVMLHFTESELVSADKLTEIGCVAMNSIESYEAEVIRNNISLIFDDEEKLRIKYYINDETDTQKILAINESFIDNLIDRNLDLLPVVVSFIRNPEVTTDSQDRKAEKVK